MQEAARAVPLRSSAIHGHRKNLGIHVIDFYPRYHVLGDQYQSCGITMNLEEKPWHVW